MFGIIQHEAGGFAVPIGSPINELLEVGLLSHPVGNRRIDGFRSQLLDSYGG
ncbi:hypothetical protein D3C76_1861210 [compost metagenome]